MNSLYGVLYIRPRKTLLSFSELRQGYGVVGFDSWLPDGLNANHMQIKKQLQLFVITASFSAPPVGLEPTTL